MNARGKSLSEIKAQIEADNHQKQATDLLHIFNSDMVLINLYYDREGERLAKPFSLDRLPAPLVNELKTFIEHLCHFHQNRAHNLQAAIEKNNIVTITPTLAKSSAPVK